MLWWKCHKFLKSFSKQQVSFSSNFASFFGSWKIIHLYFFSSNNIYFAQKKPIKVKILETFECSGQNLSNSLCQFWNDKWIPFQILNPSSVSWKITRLYFFNSIDIYFSQREPIKVKIFETFECSCQNLSNCLRQLKKKKVNFASLFIFMKDNSSVLFYLKQYIVCSKEAY